MNSERSSLPLGIAAAVATTMAASSLYWIFFHPNSSSSSSGSDEPTIKKGIILYRFDPPSGQPYGNKSCSPFGIKVETFLRLCGLEYTTPPFSLGSILRNRKRKLPTCEIDGVLVPDSTFIIDHLWNHHSNYATQCQQALCDKTLTPQQRAIGVAVKALCEDSLYYMIGYWRYQTDPGFAMYMQCNPILHQMPQPFKYILEQAGRKGNLEQLWQQGTGRHDPSQVEKLGQDAVDSLEALLEGQNYLLGGDKPSSYDATLFATCSAIVEMNVESPLKDYTLEKRNIMAYVDRINKMCGWS